jgi:hypothetical protein
MRALDGWYAPRFFGSMRSRGMLALSLRAFISNDYRSGRRATFESMSWSHAGPPNKRLERTAEKRSRSAASR